jgi:hypothetical protein
LQLSIRAAKRDLEILSNYMIEQGSPGIVLKNGGVDGFFLSSRRDAALKSQVERFVSARTGKARLEWNIVQPEDWEHSWKRFIKPARIGRNFWVTPPWLKQPKFRRRRIITIEPGMAFGTGTHATTRSCIELLEIVAAKIPGTNGAYWTSARVQEFSPSQPEFWVRLKFAPSTMIPSPLKWLGTTCGSMEWEAQSR